MYLKRIAIALAVFGVVQNVYAADETSKDASEQEKPAKVKAVVENEKDICSLETLLSSDFMRTSVWPGLGPFQNSSQDGGNVFTDAGENHFTYTTVGKKISSCQLELRSGVSETQSLMSLQMSVDFLLEALGVQPGQVHTVNAEIEKSSKLLTGNNYNPVAVRVAPLVVSFQNLGVKEGTQNPLYRIAIINEDLAAHTNVASNKIAPVKETVPHTEPVAETKLQSVKAQSNKTLETKRTEEKDSEVGDTEEKGLEVKNPEVKNPAVIKEAKVTESNPIKKEVKPVTPAKSLSKEEQLKKDLLTAIQNWQNVKKTAVRQRQTDILSQALSGKALARQTDAIKWLANNHKYYEMTPAGAAVEKISPVIAGKKYLVFAEVREKTKYIDEASGQVIKETDDTYKVNYTIEKMGDHWLISDSALVKSTAEKSNKPIATKSSPKSSQ